IPDDILFNLGLQRDPSTNHILPLTPHASRRPKVVLWGTGSPRREFLHVDDLADACLFRMENYSDEQLVNVGVGEDVTIRDLAELVRGIVGFDGEVVWDDTKPDGTPRKLLDVSRLKAMGWQARISLEEGIRQVFFAMFK
ncbi:MAG: NAD-dependent epimerase/dehydratase family protein, partial [Mariprofundaceae bacterium]